MPTNVVQYFVAIIAKSGYFVKTPYYKGPVKPTNGYKQSTYLSRIQDQVVVTAEKCLNRC